MRPPGLPPGIAPIGDYNGREQEGFRRWQMTIRDGRRCSAARAYLKPALSRSNLRVEVGALVSRVVLDRNRAVGVEYLRGGVNNARPGRP